MAFPKTIMAFIAFISLLVSTTFAVDVFSTTNVVTYWVNYDLYPEYRILLSICASTGPGP